MASDDLITGKQDLIDIDSSHEVKGGAALLRLRYSKTGRSRYISHLDLMTTLGRALLRAGVSLKYSEGFNPHPYISVALPLPVGCASVCELADIRVDGSFQKKKIPAQISSALPEGLEILEAYSPTEKFSGIARVKLECALYYDSGIAPDVADRLRECFSAGSIIIPRKTKRGMSDIDIAPHIINVEFSGYKPVTMTATVSAQNPSVSPSMLVSAIEQCGSAPPPEHYLFTRAEIYDISMNVFR